MLNQYVKKKKKKYNSSYKTKISVLYSYYCPCFSKPKHRNRTVLEKAQELLHWSCNLTLSSVPFI